MKGRYIFGRAAIVAAVLLWIINALMWYMGSDNVVEAFTSNAEQYGNARIIAQGKYGTVYLNDNAKAIILEDMADKIGAVRYTIETKRGQDEQTTTLYQEGTNGSVECSIQTIESKAADQSIRAEQYFTVIVDLYDCAQAAPGYADIVDDIFAKYGIEPETSLSYYGRKNEK